MTDVSVIGLGDMGSALARALLASGKSVTVWNRSAAKAEPLVALGAAAADTAEAAIQASDVTVTCLKSHDQTLALLTQSVGALSGKTIIELSTGGASEAEKLGALLEENGADWIIGTISAYPSGVGKAETMLFVVATDTAWETHGDIVKILGGASVRVGDQAGMLAALFAALFTTRQGFMFGMIYGALICRKAGIPVQTFSDLVPDTFDMIENYHAYFSQTIAENFESDEASLKTYSAALDDALSSFEHAGAPDALPRLFSDLARQGREAGLDNKALTALINLMDR